MKLPADSNGMSSSTHFLIYPPYQLEHLRPFFLPFLHTFLHRNDDRICLVVSAMLGAFLRRSFPIIFFLLIYFSYQGALKTVCIEEILALLVTLHTTLCAANALSGNAPEQALALVAVGGRGGGPQHEIVRSGA